MYIPSSVALHHHDLQMAMSKNPVISVLSAHHAHPTLRILCPTSFNRVDDVERVTEFLEQHSAEYHVRVVELTEIDREVMELSVE